MEVAGTLADEDLKEDIKENGTFPTAALHFGDKTRVLSMKEPCGLHAFHISAYRAKPAKISKV